MEQKRFYVFTANGATTQYHRDLKGCLSHKITDNKQKQLDVNEGRVESEVAIANFEYNHAKYQKISCNTPRNDCISTFELEKKKLKTMLGSVNRVSLTTDFWKSEQKIGFMCLTCHFVDSNWKLQKRIINFCDVPPPHSGVVNSDAIFKSLLDWGLENKVCTITLDNANNNGAAVRILKDVIKRKLMLGGKIFHVHCCAHIINLLVQDGLSEIETVIENVYESVKYLIASEARLIKFGEIAKQLQLPSKKLILDCPTHWNATYAMLVAALEFREVFPRYKDRDAGYNWLPSNED
ncbi:zinc finger BED domain-containing protein RICESLEEPER 2-like [Castanea sativa]|uniref:zinc finger BED domain-containing protein RICESLEEPER 2-like n=1 Tax=Castanea sativa TaxID=21020 RepID=UPI003F64A0EC